MATYNVLSLDGGGCRGVITARLTEAIARQVPGFVGRVDLFAGSSIGAATAFSLAQRGTTEGIVDFFRVHGPTLFERRWLRGWP